MGQDCYFLGFPLGFSTKLSQGMVPLIKRATTSGLRDIKGKNILLLDGHNNVGFSGGPVITTNSGLKEQFVIGIVSGYFPDPQVIEVPDDKGGTKKITYNSNSGIILCFQTDLAVEIIKNIK